MKSIFAAAVFSLAVCSGTSAQTLYPPPDCDQPLSKLNAYDAQTCIKRAQDMHTIETGMLRVIREDQQRREQRAKADASAAKPWLVEDPARQEKRSAPAPKLPPCPAGAPATSPCRL
jgi:hypothetical protein